MVAIYLVRKGKVREIYLSFGVKGEKDCYGPEFLGELIPQPVTEPREMMVCCTWEFYHCHITIVPKLPTTVFIPKW